MSKVSEKTSQLIQETFCPVVAVLTSFDVESLCQKNNLSFCDLLLPFSQLTSEAQELCPWYVSYRDGFLRWVEPADHEFLRSYLACVLVVSTNHADPMDQLAKLSQSQHAQQHLVGQSAPSLPEVSGGPAYAATPRWFLPNIFKYHVLVHDVAQGDDKKAESVYQSMKIQYGAHACHLLRINSGNNSAFITPEHHETELGSSAIPDPWKSSLTNKYRGFQAGLKLAKSQGRLTSFSSANQNSPSQPELNIVNGEPVGVVGDVVMDGTVSDAQMITENSADPGSRGLKPRTYRSESIPHALSSNDLSSMTSSHHQETEDLMTSSLTSSSPKYQDQQAVSHGELLTPSDRDRVKVFVQEFATRGLATFVERQMRLLNEQVVNRKGFHKSIFNVTKKWLGGSGSISSPTAHLPPAGTQGTAVVYSDSSAEMQMRRLADLAFLFQNYSLAYQVYDILKKDFAADHAWLYYAGALEMISLCAFLLGSQHSKPYQTHYMDNALVSYMNTCGKPLCAIRAAFLSTEVLLAMDMQSEAANHFIRMTSGDSDLCSALFLEQASLAFKSTKMNRKYALHMILAGHRFSKAGHRAHSLRCYQLAGAVYAGKGWKLAEDHIHFTVGHQALGLKRKEDAVQARALLLMEESQQYPSQQELFFKDYLSVLLDLNKEERSSKCRDIHLPFIDSQNIKVFLGGLEEDWQEMDKNEEIGESFRTSTAACGQGRKTFQISENSSNNIWSKLEENCWLSSDRNLTASPRDCS